MTRFWIVRNISVWLFKSKIWNWNLQWTLIVRVVHGDTTIKPYKCDAPECSYSAHNRSYLENHKKTHWENKEYVCQICNEIFPASRRSENNYVNHYRLAHNKENPPEFMNKKKYLCSECPRSFFKETSFQSHVSYHKRISLGHKVVKKAILKPYECRICEVTILGRLNYVSHCKTSIVEIS